MTNEERIKEFTDSLNNEEAYAKVAEASALYLNWQLTKPSHRQKILDALDEFLFKLKQNGE
jgi:hypothetical protein